MGSLREDLDTAYQTAHSLAKTRQEREKLRKDFKRLFAAAAETKKRTGIRIPIPDPLGILTDASKDEPVQLFDPLFSRKKESKKTGEKLCDKLDDEEMLDFANVVCEEGTSEHCITQVYEYAVSRKEGEIDDEGFNRSVTRTLKHYGVVPKGDYATMLKMRSPCMVDEILKLCNYDPECLDKFQKLAESLDDPFAFRRELEKLEKVIP